MRWRTFALLGSLVLTLTSTTTARAAGARSSPRPRIAVRVYDTLGVPAAALTDARASLEDVARASGFDIVWRRCQEAGPDPCVDPLVQNELVIRLIHSPRETSGVAKAVAAQLPLGSSVIAAPGRRSRFASVFPDRVRTLAARGGIPEGQLLGYAIAHELGHLLLSSDDHSADGLMRAHWTALELERGQSSDWRLLPEQAAAIHARLAPPEMVAGGGPSGGRVIGGRVSAVLDRRGEH